MKKHFIIQLLFVLFVINYTQAQVQWASKLIDFSSEYKDEFIKENSTRWSAVQVLGYPNTMTYSSSQMAWTPKNQDGSKEFVTVGFEKPQTVQQVIVGENMNSGAISQIILFDSKGKKYTVYDNPAPQPTRKMDNVLTYFKTTPTYDVVKLKLVLNTNAVFGREEIDCIGISSNTNPYVQNINVIKYSEQVGAPENLGSNVNSSYYDHLPIISPDGSLLYFTRKLSDESNHSAFDDDIYFSRIMPTGAFAKAENIGPPLNNSEHNFICYVSSDNNRLYVANKYLKNTYNFSGLSVSTKQKDNSWSKPKALPIPDLYNKNEFAHYYLSINENTVLMCLFRDDSYGDLDIYVSQKYGDGNWSKPKNLGPVINTVGAEGSVFLAADGKTMYFSSSGQPGFGGYDMYMSKRLDDTWTNWSKPLNLGDKINTNGLDIYYTIPASGDYAYFSSGRTMYGLNDLYRIKLPKEIRPEYVDTKKILATVPINQVPTTVNAQLTKAPQTTNVVPEKVNQPTTPVTSTKVNTPTEITVAPVNKPSPTTNPATDDLQKKLEELKKQQTQTATQPTSTRIETTPSSTQPVAVTTPTVNKREVVNPVQANKPADTLRRKTEIVNYIKPPEPPKPTPNILTKEEIAAREAQKNNPSINPNNDVFNKKLNTPMSAEPVANNTVKVPTTTSVTSPPNYKINEVEPTQPITNTTPPTTYNQPLKTSSPQTDELQQKLEELKKQQTQNAINKQQPITYTPTDTRTIAEQYPNPEPVATNYSAKTDNMQQKLDALKQQQYQVGQSTKIAANPYEQKPYEAQPVKERQEDVASKEYDDYQKKLDELKKQQKNAPNNVTKKQNTNSTIADNTPTTSNYTTYNTPTVNETKPVVTASVPTTKNTPTNTVSANAPAVATTTTNNPILAKYEEKLRKLKEEMEAMKQPAPEDKRIAENIQDTPKEPENIIATPVINTTPVETIVVENKPVIEQPVLPIENNEIATPITPTETKDLVDIAALNAERDKLDSIQTASKLAEQRMLSTLNKMDANKQTLESDIADLQSQRNKFSEEKEKLSAQNAQLSGEKEKLELEKKQMDDLLAQMQSERDKLAAEKLKMEQDKAKLDLLKKQQEKQVIDLKRSIDSLANVQQSAANNAQLQKQYDLFNVPIKVGAVAIADRIFFVADGAFLTIPSYPEIDKVVAFLKKNDKLKIEIGGHTNGLCDDVFCNKLSNDRAKTCVDYLVSKGISRSRLTYKGYGKQHLIAAPGSPLNQRVEIKILSVD